MCTWAGEHYEAAFSDLFVAVRGFSMMSAAWSLNPPIVVHNLMKVVDKRLDYQVNFVQFRYFWHWGTCLLYGMWGCPLHGMCGVPHFRGLAYTQT